jgi:UDP-N-acetyl-D-glucosamine/UDP-N-acetyl-D-galactosamine dehydrogenase
LSIYQRLKTKQCSVSVTGLGYVGLPLALEFARHFRVIGFDINQERVALMKQGIDPSKELSAEAFEGCDITFTSDPEDLREGHFHIIGVPTDIDEHKVPDLNPLLKASQSVGRALKPGDYVVYESTVYPGCTEEDCVPVLEKASGLKGGVDFKYGYSPERIVPGDKVRTLTNILKIVSGNDVEALEEISKVYGEIITAGLHRASSVKVAEAAKVIENTQRDINISLMNELAIIFDRMGIDTREVIEAAGTKWNFHKYYPGLVGGHCISVDPFYLMHKARELGYEPQVIAAGRRVNDYMPHFVVKKVVQALIENGKNPGECRVLVMGITFKEDVADIRNSKVVNLVRELKDYSITVDVIDPHASIEEVRHEYDIELRREPEGKYDAVVVAVGHTEFLNYEHKLQLHNLNPKWIVFDIKGVFTGSGAYAFKRL